MTAGQQHDAALALKAHHTARQVAFGLDLLVYLLRRHKQLAAQLLSSSSCLRATIVGAGATAVAVATPSLEEAARLVSQREELLGALE